MKMSPQIKDAVADCSPALVATANKAGRPNVSAKGSLRVVDDEHLLFADIRSPRTMINLKENPHVAVICLNPATHKGCRIWGRAEIMISGDLFDQLAKEYAGKNMKVNHVVKITVDEAFGF